MNKVKTIVIAGIVIALLFAIAVFAGCTGGGDTVNTQKPGGTDNGEDPAATEAVTPAPTSDPAKIFTDTLAKVEPNPDQHVTMATTDDGYDIFAPLDGKWGYRYGPSIMYYPDGSVDAWFATPGTSGEWDWFTYKHSDDGGKTWSKAIVAMRPTPTADILSSSSLINSFPDVGEVSLPSIKQWTYTLDTPSFLAMSKRAYICVL